MRILQVSPYWAPAWGYGGPPRVMHAFAAGLVERGHDVTVHTTDVLDGDGRSGPSREVMDGVAVRRFRNLSNSLAWQRKKYFPPALVASTLLEARRFDIVHVTDARTVPTVSGFLGALVGRSALCLSAHGSLPASQGLRGLVKRAYDTVLVRPMVARSSLLLAQTDHEAALYASFGGAEQHIHLLPLPLPPLGQSADQGAFRRRIGVSDDVRMILFLGRLSPLKGVDLLLDAVGSILNKSTIVVLVGRDDGHLAHLRRRFAPLFADGRVRFVGPVYGSERFQAYADADVFCLTPTHWEETSVAALEAASCGTPVVVTEQADMPGLQAASGGFVVPASAARIRSAVERALDDHLMGARAAEHVRTVHDVDRIVDRLEALMRNEVDRRAI